MTFDEWWRKNAEAIESASPKLLKNLFELAWWTGKLHAERKQEKKDVSKEEGHSIPLNVSSFNDLFTDVFMGRNQAAPDLHDSRPGSVLAQSRRRPSGGADFGPRGG